MDLVVGQRYLIKTTYTGSPFSVEALEISPSGKHIKVQYEASGHIAWLGKSDFWVIEKLGGKPIDLQNISTTLTNWFMR